MIEYKVYFRAAGTTIASTHKTFAAAAGTARSMAGCNQTIYLGANIDGCHSGLLYKYTAGSRTLVNKGFLQKCLKLGVTK